MGIIKSLLDTDFYNFTMMQAVLHQYPATYASYTFKWRNWDFMKLDVSLETFCKELNRELNSLCELRFKTSEYMYFSEKPYFTLDFVEYLKLFKLDRKHIQAYIEDDELKISVNGPWVNTIMFDTVVLSIVSELYTKHNGIPEEEWLSKGRQLLHMKTSWLNSTVGNNNMFKYVDFGTRRRASYLWHKEVLEYQLLHCPKNLIGTSNVLLAKNLGIKPFGTMAHQYIQAHQQLGVRLTDSQKVAFQSWASEYRGELGIALSDTLGTKAFLNDFDRYFALLFDGCRHDSGNPVKWAEQIIAHYKKLRIDPKTKHLVFSDGLTFKTAVDLFYNFGKKAIVSFGIGTNLTNDCGFIAPQIVLKLTSINGSPVAKVCNTSSKNMCIDPEFFDYLKKIIHEKHNNDGNYEKK